MSDWYKAGGGAEERREEEKVRNSRGRAEAGTSANTEVRAGMGMGLES
jgi:hypothetical protein